MIDKERWVDKSIAEKRSMNNSDVLKLLHYKWVYVAIYGKKG